MENKISVLIITHNNEDVIEECIKSVHDLASEVIVVDSYSVDKTRVLAEKLGARVVENKFKDFADQRNLAAGLAVNDWILYVDSDERATPKFVTELKDKIKGSSDETAGFWIRRKTYFLGKDWGLTDRVQRVFKKDKLKGWFGVVHETPKVQGKLETISEPILHKTHRNLEQMIDKTNEWSEYEAELRLKAGHPRMNLFRFFRVIMTGFINSYYKEGGWKNGTEGVIESTYQAFSMFITYAKLWEKQRAK